MDIAIAGPGELVIRFIDQTGSTLIQEKLVVSGSPNVQARRTIVLYANTTTRGRVPVSPVLVRQSNPEQRVTFDSEQPSYFTARRCREIGCATDVVNEIERACAAPPIQGVNELVMSDDQAIYKVIQESVGRKRSGAK
jgi:hypothetical protein